MGKITYKIFDLFRDERRCDGMDKDFCIFSQTMAGWLMLNGCKLKKIAPSKQDSNKYVYYFPNTEYVNEYVQKYIENRK